MACFCTGAVVIKLGWKLTADEPQISKSVNSIRKPEVLLTLESPNFRLLKAAAHTLASALEVASDRVNASWIVGISNRPDHHGATSCSLRVYLELTTGSAAEAKAGLKLLQEVLKEQLH